MRWRLYSDSSDEEDTAKNKVKKEKNSEKPLPGLSIYDRMLLSSHNVSGSALEKKIASTTPQDSRKRSYRKYLCESSSSDEEEPIKTTTTLTPTVTYATTVSPAAAVITPPTDSSLTKRRSNVSFGDLLHSSVVSLPETYASLFTSPSPAASTRTISSCHLEDDEWMDSATAITMLVSDIPHVTPTRSTPSAPKALSTPGGKSTTPSIDKQPILTSPSASIDDSTVKPQLLVPPRRDQVEIALPSSNTDILASAIPATAVRYLFDHQISGVKWLWTKYTTGNGAILGDDMGLGKSVQVACLLLAIYHKTGLAQDKQISRTIAKDGISLSSSKGSKFPALIVAPASVLENWRRELTTWGYLLVETMGSKHTAEESIERAHLGKCEVLLTSYTKMTTHANALASIQWSVIVWDEGHQLKGDRTKSYTAAYSIKKAQCRFILSGTPIQNCLEELWSLLNLITQGQFHDKKTFKDHFSDPIKRSQQRSANDNAVELGERRQKELRRLVEKYMLQRTKNDIFEDELLGKDDVRVFCELTQLQKDLYEYLFTLPDFDNVRQHNQPCPACDSHKKRGQCCQNKYIQPLNHENGDIDSRAVIWRRNHVNDEVCDACPTCVALPIITVLSAVASHPLLLQANPYEQDEEEYSMRLEFATKALSPPLLEALGGAVSTGEGMVATRMEMSGKMKTLDVLLRTFSQRMEKTLIFSESTRVLSLIEDYIKCQGWRYCRLDGSTATSKRQQLVDTFNNDKGILAFLISTRAGGLGLNLTSASNVILYDVAWNPSLDAQAQDRCYRYGQLKKVTVYRLIAQGTIEELKYMRQLYKQAMQRVALGDNIVAETGRRFEGIQGDKSARGELFGLENLLQYEEGSILLKLRDKYSDKPAAPKEPNFRARRDFDNLSLCTEEELTAAMTRGIENNEV